MQIETKLAWSGTVIVLIGLMIMLGFVSGRYMNQAEIIRGQQEAIRDISTKMNELDRNIAVIGERLVRMNALGIAIQSVPDSPPGPSHRPVSLPHHPE